MEWSNEVIMKFLDMYKREPAKWNPQNKQNKNRNYVYDSWRRIQTQISVERIIKEEEV